MAIYVVVRPHPYIHRGARYYEDVGDGLVQPVTMEMDEGRYKPYRNYGIALPREVVRDALLRIQVRGVDERGLRG